MEIADEERLNADGRHRGGQSQPRSIGLWKQPIPRASERLLDPHRGRHKDGYRSCLDLLYGADIQVCQLGQPFLCEPSRHTLPPHAGTESIELGLLFLVWHALLRRMIRFDWNGPLGRKVSTVRRTRLQPSGESTGQKGKPS